MISQVQNVQNFDIAAAPMQVEEEGRFQWTQARKSIVNSACLALIYLNGGSVELRKERVTNGKQKSFLIPQTIEHILQRGNFSEFKTLPKNAVEGHIKRLRQKSRKKGSTLEEELLKQYQDLQAKTIVNNKREKTSLLLQELNKFGIKPEEYDQWISIESCFKWDEEREEIFKSACLALIYLNGGKIELRKERVSRGRQISFLSPKAIEHILQRGNFLEFKTVPQKGFQNCLETLRAKSKKRGLRLEEELLKEYQELEAKTIINDAGEETSLLLQELNKFGIKPEEYDQWVPIESCFKWDEKTTAILHSACLALIYLNGGGIEVSKERRFSGRQKGVLSAKGIEQILQRGNFSEFKTVSKKGVERCLDTLRAKSKKRGLRLEEELLKEYQELEAKTIVNDAGEEIPALWLELRKFGIDPTEQDTCVAIEPSSTKNPRKRPAEESPDPEAEPVQKRANHATEAAPQANQLTNLRHAIEVIRSEIMN